MLGLFIQIAFALTLLVLWQMTDSLALYAGMWLAVGAILTWLFSAIFFYARQLELVEELENRALNAGSDSSIFSGKDADALRPAARRVSFMKKYFVPAVTLILAAYNLLIGYWIFNQFQNANPIYVSTNASAAVFLVLLGFGGFLFSRYATGMSHASCWRFLRAPGSFLLICVIAAALQFTAVMTQVTYPKVDTIIAIATSAFMILFGAEMVLNFILNIYRPKLPSEEYIPSYESRLLNLLADPSRVGHSIADTLNYQFGFEVSKTWFYQLLSKAVTPMIIFALLVMLGLSSIVIVRPGEKCVIKAMGKITAIESEGMAFKLPWPLGSVDRFEVGKLHNIEIGVLDEAAKDSLTTSSGQEIILWSKAHGYKSKQERSFVVAQKSSNSSFNSEAGVSNQTSQVALVKFVMLVQYKIVDVEKYGYSFSNAHELINRIAQQEAVKYCAQATLEDRLDSNANPNPKRPQAIMSSGRTDAGINLKNIIASRLNKLQLGVEIVNVGIMSAHPPLKAVEASENVLKAEREIDVKRYKAEATVAKILAQVSGNPDLALKFSLEVKKKETLSKLINTKRSSQEFIRWVDDAQTDAKKNFDNLKKELIRDQLLGKIPGELSMQMILELPEDSKEFQKLSSDIASKIKLAIDYQDFAKLLASIRKAPDKFDFKTQLAKSTAKVDELYEYLQGEPAVIISQARSKAWQDTVSAQAEVYSNRKLYRAYIICPELFRAKARLKCWSQIISKSPSNWFFGCDSDKIQARFNWNPYLGNIENTLEEATSENENK